MRNSILFQLKAVCEHKRMDYQWDVAWDCDLTAAWASVDYMRYALAAKNDVYGALFFHLRDFFTTFSSRVRTCKVKFQLGNIDVSKMDLFLDLFGPRGMRFDSVVVDLDRLEKGFMVVF